MLARSLSATLCGVEGRPVQVEVHVAPGLPGFTIVGLPDASCRESRDRVRAAILSSGLSWPQRRITVNLAPSGERKVGSGLDVAVAVALLVASEQLPVSALDDRGFVGELGLDGSIRPVAGMVPLALAIDVEELVVAPSAGREVALVGRHVERVAATLAELVAVLRGEQPWSAWTSDLPFGEPDPSFRDLADVRGQVLARRGLEVAAAGGHHMLMVGPPGGGKTMLAERLPGLLGPLTAEQSLSVTVTHSAAGLALPGSGLVRWPPFRAPHHSASLVAMVGGGSQTIRPGELSLAAEGVLFLDELGEFPPRVLDCLRQPLEAGVIRVSRSGVTAELPANVLLIAAMNPCPCGFAPTAACQCSPASLARYARRLSGPVLDRLDVRVVVYPATRSELLDQPPGEPTAVVAERVALARSRARTRGVLANAQLTGSELDDITTLTADGRRLLERALDCGRLSARGLRRVRCVALTLDDLRGGDSSLDAEVIAEALALRADVAAGGIGCAA